MVSTREEEVAPAASAAELAPTSLPDPLDVPLIATGCRNNTISEIMKGTYFRCGTNHGRPVYKKMREKAQNGDDLDVVIYFWDQQDTDGDCGWWIGPSIGGELVWAYHPSKA